MIKAVVWDFDSTIAESAEFCLEVYKSTLEKFLGRRPESIEITSRFSMSEPGVLRDFLGGINEKSIAAEDYFYQRHRDLHPVMCQEVFDGIREIFEYLMQNGIKMALLTGRTEKTAEISMDFLKIREYFSAFKYGSEIKIDKAAQLRELMDFYGISNAEVLYIGDSPSDVAACNQAEVKCLSAAWAKSVRSSDLQTINPGLVFETVADMAEYIRKNL